MLSERAVKPPGLTLHGWRDAETTIVYAAETDVR